MQDGKFFFTQLIIIQITRTHFVLVDVHRKKGCQSIKLKTLRPRVWCVTAKI